MFSKQLIEKLAKKIIIFSRDEFKQSEVKTKIVKIMKKFRFFIGDVRDKDG